MCLPNALRITFLYQIGTKIKKNIRSQNGLVKALTGRLLSRVVFLRAFFCGLPRGPRVKATVLANVRISL